MEWAIAIGLWVLALLIVYGHHRLDKRRERRYALKWGGSQ